MSARRRRVGQGRIAVALLVTAVPMGASAASVEATVDEPARLGDVVVVDADALKEEIEHGGSATAFALRLPDGAACPGDSANDQWRIQSFVVPASDDPGVLQYELTKPVGEGRWALYGVDTSPATHLLTAPNVGAGQPGLITGLPAFSFAVFPPDTLTDGRYRIGIACTYFRDTATYWDTEVVVTSDAGDEPGRMTWRLSSARDADVSGNGGGSGVSWSWIAAGGLSLVAVALYLVSRRSPPHNHRNDRVLEESK